MIHGYTSSGWVNMKSQEQVKGKVIVGCYEPRLCYRLYILKMDLSLTPRKHASKLCLQFILEI